MDPMLTAQGLWISIHPKAINRLILNGEYIAIFKASDRSSSTLHPNYVNF
jgi:hypothetical protein